MRFEVLTKDDMNELSRLLSKAGIMNRTREELGWELSHTVVIRGKFGELRKIDIEPVRQRLGEIEATFRSLIKEIKEGKEIEELLDDTNDAKVEVFSALVEAGFLDIGECVKLKKEPALEELKIELRFPMEDVIEYVEDLEKHGAKLVTEIALIKRYYVEVMEIEEEAIAKAIEIAGEYATEESLVEAMFSGLAKSALAKRMLELVEDIRRKDELIEIMMEQEPIILRGKDVELAVYYEEDAIEDLLKELQTLGYLKVKGNRVWPY
ncbi:hypothetical protein [Pyrococcus yayanosii]|uniref:Uncharacterized protein n=1 Tax=Pyrococcus yayanosii (strain CH1 / JCM 16557) TaxID=529709 RepID=F8AFH4_PYRYC|nr:hypothetical protein [Pyrococcus yayanosii]AEH23785.1 hypothetical protein PYCH_00720 [Pyrococcus yayanosii CH1]